MTRPSAFLVSANNQPFGETPRAVQMAGNTVDARSATTRRTVHNSRRGVHRRGTQRKIAQSGRAMMFRGVLLRHSFPPLAAIDRVKTSVQMYFKFSPRCPAWRSLRRALYLPVQPARAAASSSKMQNDPVAYLSCLSMPCPSTGLRNFDTAHPFSYCYELQLQHRLESVANVHIAADLHVHPRLSNRADLESYE
jgi:hypothetical protein